MKSDQILLYVLSITAMMVLMFAMVGYVEWKRTQLRREAREAAEFDRDEKRRLEELEFANKRRDEDLARQQRLDAMQRELEERRIEVEHSRISSDRDLAFRAESVERERFTASNSGAGSGGYVVIDVPDADRSLFHDLAKGFEDYARLKGYGVAFSIDNSWEGRTAYKFTVTNRGVTIGPEEVRKDFKEYAERVRHDDDDFDDMPVITNMAEHNLIVTMLKNRVVFFRANYKAYRNTVSHLEKLISGNALFPALPQPPINIYNNGASVDTRNYNANNSQRLIQGENNTYEDHSISIGGSVNEKMERIVALDDMISKLKAVENGDETIAKATVDLVKVREELSEYPNPNESSIRRWLEHAKNLMTAAILGHELYEASMGLWHMFGMP